MHLSKDLKTAVSEPFLLFRTSGNPNVSELKGHCGAYVTDGPFYTVRTEKRKWSGHYNGRYLVLDAWNDTLDGKWQHGGSRFDFDGGHAMMFEKLDGTKMISLHSPNTANMERAAFHKI